MLLEHYGHRVLEEPGRATVLERLKTERADLLITDILMPGMDGFQLLRRLRSDPATAATPVIVYTGVYRERETRLLAQACGAAHVPVKPASSDTRMRAVARVRGAPAPALPHPAADKFEREHARLLTDKLLETVRELERVNGQLAALVALGRELSLGR